MRSCFENSDEKRDEYHNAPNEKEMPKNKFRIVSLHFPADYSNSLLMDLMNEARSFHMWFERDLNKKDQLKKGGISLTFDDEYSAKQMYLKIKNQKFNGMKLKIHASKTFDDDGSPMKLPKNLLDVKILEDADPQLHQKLFVSQLLPTTDDDLIYAVFGKENLNHVEIFIDDKRKDGTKTAILTFLNRELAEQSKQDYDGFVVDDGELSKPMKILLYVDYLQKKENEKHKLQIKNEKKVKNDDEMFEENLHKEVTPDINSEENLTNSTDISLQHCDNRGKAGNLWSAQIVENRCPETTNEKVVIPEQKVETIVPDTVVPVVPVEPHWPEKKEDSSESPVSQQPQFSGELSVAELQHWINFVVERDRINLGELNSVEELWLIVNNVVKETGWQPEETLKEAMLKALEVAVTSQDAKWWQNHTNFLIKIWKKEVDLEARSKTRVKLQLAETTGLPSETASKPDASDYVPRPRSPKIKRKTAGKKALMELMGVGALLANVQKEAAENENRQSETPVVLQDSATNSKLKSTKPPKQAKKRRRRSSCESGEASSTTSESEESEISMEPPIPASVPETSHREEHKRRREKRKKKSEHRPNQPAATSDSVAKNPNVSRVENDQRYATYAPNACPNPPNPVAATSTMNPQTWMTQFMPTFMQMMPMMMQMSQMRMMSMSTMTPQQQQQMSQCQQQMAQMFSQFRAAGPNQAAFSNPMNMMAFLQRMPSMNVQTNGSSYGSTTHQQANYESTPQQPQNARYGYSGYPNY